MLKHMLTATSPSSVSAPNGSISGRHIVSRPDSSMVMEPRIDPSSASVQQQQQNHRYRSAGNLNSTGMPLRIHQQPLNISTLTSSKHSIGGNSSSISPGNNQPPKISNGGLNISRVTASNLSPRTPQTPNNIGSVTNVSKFVNRSKEVGIKEMLVSLGLLCLVSLLLALLSLIFLLKISPVTANDIRELLRAEQLTVITAEEYVVVYEVTLALCALTLSLNLCCLLVCAIQFLFAVKLVKSPHGGNDRTNKYLQKSSISRVCAVAGFFISIPVFLTGIILYTFIQFHSTPAIVTSAFIGLGIIFCGCAMVHNVFIWQREKTNAVKAFALQQHQQETAAAAAATSAVNAATSSGQLYNQSQSQNISITNPNVLNSATHHNSSHHHNHSYNILHSTLNQSHLSSASNHLGPYIIRPSTTTPPTSADMIAGHAKSLPGHLREASGSISPGVPIASVGLDMSSVGTTNSPHELSTLV